MDLFIYLENTNIYSTGIQTSANNQHNRTNKKRTAYRLWQNYPNPFNHRTIIDYKVQKADDVKISIFNFVGQQIKILLDEPRSKGDYSISWEGKDEQGMLVSNGVYFYQLEVGDYTSAKTMILVK